CVAERALCYLRRKAQPSGVETVKVAGKTLIPGIDFLEPQVNQLSPVAYLHVLDDKAIELMAVDGEMAFPRIIPLVFLVNGNTDQMRHHLCQPQIVVTLHPHHLHAVFGIGELANVAQEFPVLFGEAPEIEIGKNVAQKNQTPELDGPQEIKRVRGTADIGAKMQVGNNDSVKTLFPHALLL